MNIPNPHHGQNAAVLLGRTYVFAAFGGRWHFSFWCQVCVGPAVPIGHRTRTQKRSFQLPPKGRSMKPAALCPTPPFEQVGGIFSRCVRPVLGGKWHVWHDVTKIARFTLVKEGLASCGTIPIRSWRRWIFPGTVSAILGTAKVLPGTILVFLGASDKRGSHRRGSHRRKSHRHTSLTSISLAGTYLKGLHLIEAYISQDLHLRCLYLMGVALSQACILEAATSGIQPSDKTSNCVPRYIPGNILANINKP